MKERKKESSAVPPGDQINPIPSQLRQARHSDSYCKKSTRRKFNFNLILCLCRLSPIEQNFPLFHDAENKSESLDDKRTWDVSNPLLHTHGFVRRFASLPATPEKAETFLFFLHMFRRGVRPCCDVYDGMDGRKQNVFFKRHL